MALYWHAQRIAMAQAAKERRLAQLRAQLATLSAGTDPSSVRRAGLVAENLRELETRVDPWVVDPLGGTAPGVTTAAEFTAAQAQASRDPVAQAAGHVAEPFKPAGLLADSGQVVVWLLVAVAVGLLLKRVA